MKRVLLTGASGFIGRHAWASLARRGFEIHAVGRARGPIGGPVQWHSADLLDPRTLDALMRTVRPTHLLHFAWYAEPRDYRESPENVRWSQAGMELLVRFAEHGGQRAVFAGSCFEYDPRWGFCAESLTPSTPETLYGTCKNALRQIALKFSNRAGISMAWGRIFYLYGPCEPPSRLVPSVILSLLRDEIAHCSHGRQMRDFMYVADVADAFAALLDSAVEGTVNVASGEPVTVRALVSRCAQLLGREGRVEFGAIQASATDPPAVLADVGRLREQVGWTPQWPLDRALAATIDWWRKTLRAPN